MKEQALEIMGALGLLHNRTTGQSDKAIIEAAIGLLAGLVATVPGGGAKVSPAPPDPSKPKVPAFLEWPEVDRREPGRVTGYSGKGRDGRGYITIGGLAEAEVDALAAMVIGACFVTMVDGRVRAWQAFEAVPDPKADPIVGPYWERAPGGLAKVGAMPKGEGWHSPTIYIHHPQSPRAVELLESYGAICLRSRRLEEGKYWETYVLHTWNIKGSLKRRIDELEAKGKLSWSERAETIAEYVARSATSGSVDIVIQRWALTCDD